MWLPGFLNVNTCHFATAIAALLPQVVGLPFDTYFNGEFIQHHIQYRMLQQEEKFFHFHKGKALHELFSKVREGDLSSNN